MRSKPVDVKVGGLRVDGAALEFGSVGHASVTLQFGQLVKHIAVSQKEGVENVGSVGNTR